MSSWRNSGMFTTLIGKSGAMLERKVLKKISMIHELFQSVHYESLRSLQDGSLPILTFSPSNYVLKHYLGIFRSHRQVLQQRV